VIGRLLDLLHISWQTCAAHQLSDHKMATDGHALSDSD
jgi:hypothetical protein